MEKLLKKLRTTAERWRTRCFEALGFVPSAELCALREAYNDELREMVAAERERRAVLERLGEFGQLFIDYIGCPRGGPGRECAPLTEELLSMPMITDVDGGRWRPVNEDALQEAILMLKERE